MKKILVFKEKPTDIQQVGRGIVEKGRVIMLVLITYDVNTISKDGQKRLRKISKCCQNYGQRVQNSVFECNVDTLLFKKLQEEISSIMDIEKDSVRYYNLGKNYETKVTHIGAKPSFDVTEPLIF